MRFLMIGLVIFFSLQGHAASTFEKIYVCVSFSVPHETLKALFHQAASKGAVLVMRGLDQNSFQETKKKMEALQINVSIDPNVFEDFGVTHVPTVIGIKKGVAYKVSGNVSLDESLQRLSLAQERGGA